MSYPYKLHFGSRSGPQLNMGRRGSTVVRADGLPLWSGGVPRVIVVLTYLCSTLIIEFEHLRTVRVPTLGNFDPGALRSYAWV